MIVVDIETSGLDFIKSGIWQIGAIDVNNPQNRFLEECRIDETDFVSNEALLVCGKTEAELRDNNKQSQRELLRNFFIWCQNSKMKNFICQNPQFDTVFLKLKAEKYNLHYPFHFRAFDLHSIASVKYFQIHTQFLTAHNYSDMGLTNILKFSGIIDTRGAHNALEDAKLTAECFSRIVYGKKLLEDYDSYDLPDYLVSII